jgi:hypothetical protein
MLNFFALNSIKNGMETPAFSVNGILHNAELLAYEILEFADFSSAQIFHEMTNYVLWI